MSAHANPDIVDDIQSYKGEPTTNLLSSPTDMEGSGWSLGNTASQITITGNQSDPFGQNNAILFGVASDGGNYPHIRQIDKITGTTSSHTISIWAKSKSGSTRFDLVCFRSNPWGTAFSKTVTLTSEWQRFELTGNPLDTTGHRVYFMCQNVSSGTATEVYMAYPQLEAKSHATQFVDGTRSVTQGLIDRTGNTTIDLSNVSFDSNAQMTFDGTDDYVTLGSDSILQDIGSFATIECWFKSSSLVGSKFAIMVGWGDGTSYYSNFGIGNWFSAWSDESIYVGINSAAVVYAERDGSAKYHDGNWHHAVALMGYNNHKIYVDGSEVSVSFSYGSNSVSTSKLFGFSSGTSLYWIKTLR